MTAEAYLSRPTDLALDQWCVRYTFAKDIIRTDNMIEPNLHPDYHDRSAPNGNLLHPLFVSSFRTN
jgi:hypothetical protein